jgi:hypothetical protein
LQIFFFQFYFLVLLISLNRVEVVMPLEEEATSSQLTYIYIFNTEERGCILLFEFNFDHCCIHG